MTKRNLTLGTASGKLGSVVYFRRRGQQIARVLVSSINDKKTLPQCLQRARFANYVGAWRMLRPYIERSWRGVSRYGSRENAFYHHNRQLMPTCSKGMSRAGYAFPPLGLLTYGSLNVSTTFAARGAQLQAGSKPLVSWSFLLPSVIAAPSTKGDLFNAIKSTAIGMEDNDIIHILVVAYGVGAQDLGYVEPAEEVAPQVYHVEISRAEGDVMLATACPWLRVGYALTFDDRHAIGLDFITDYLPAEPESGFIDKVMAVFVERPRNPQYARYTRSKFTSYEDAYNLLRSLCNDTDVAVLFAETFRTV